jgi:hypothetical protein
MRAVPPVLLTHQHGVTVRRHLFPLFPAPASRISRARPAGRFWFERPID